MDLEETVSELGLFEPDVIMPSQTLHEPARPRELRLIAALVESALDDLRAHRHATTREGRLLYQAAERWLLGAPAVVPFSRCCDLLGLDMQAVQAAVR